MIFLSRTKKTTQLIFTSLQQEKVYLMRLQCDRGVSFEAVQAKRDEAMKEGRSANFYTPKTKMATHATSGIILALGHGR